MEYSSVFKVDEKQTINQLVTVLKCKFSSIIRGKMKFKPQMIMEMSNDSNVINKFVMDKINQILNQDE